MPKIAKELTVLEIKRLGQGTFAIGGVKGLYIRKTPTQTLFILRYSDATGRHDFSLGSFPETSVAAARKAAREARALIDKGGSPIEEREGQRKAKKRSQGSCVARSREKQTHFRSPNSSPRQCYCCLGLCSFCSASGRQLTNASPVGCRRTSEPPRASTGKVAGVRKPIV